MSLNELSNSVFPNTLNGLDSLNVTDITVNGQTLNTLFVPYTGAVSNTDLNNKSLTGVNTLSATSVTASGLIQGLNVTATGLTTTNTLKINSVPAGTVVKALAVDASGNVIEGSLIPSQINVSAITPGYASPMYFSYIITNSAGDRVLYVDTVDPISYNTSSKTLSIKNLTASAGSNWTNYGTTFSQVLNCAGLSISSTATFPQFCNFSTAPNVGTPAYFLALNAVNEVVVATGISAQPTITATNTNATFYLTFAPNATTTSSSALYVDGGSALTYNAFSNTLTVPIADIPTSLTANGSFTANGSNSIAGYAPLASPALSGTPTAPTAIAGTNTTQIATTQFVTTAVGAISGYAPINSPTFTGTPNAPTPALGNNSTRIATTAYVVNEFAPLASPSFNGTPFCPTATAGTNNFQIANTSFVATSFAPLASPVFTGTPNGPTQSFGNNSTALATTAFVQSAVGVLSGYLPLTGGTMTGTIGIDAGNLGFLLMQNDKNVAYSYTIGSNGTSGANTWLTLRSPASMIGIAPLLTITPPTSCSSTLDVTGATTITGQTTSNGGIIINSGGLNYANFGGSSLNLIRGNTVFYGSVATGGNAVLQVDWTSGINASVLNTATYNWQFVTGGSGTTAMNLSPSLLTTNTNINFNVSGVATAGVNSIGLYANNAGYMTNDTGAGNAGLTGYGPGDLIFYANSSGVMRFYTGSNNKVAIGAGQIYVDKITMFALASVGIDRVAIGLNQVNHRNTYGKLTLNSRYTDDPAEGFVIDAGDGSTPAGNYRLHIYPYVQAGAQVGYKFGTHNNGTNYESYRLLHNGDFRFAKNVIYAGTPSITFEGNGVNYFMVGYQSGYWDTGPGGAGNWRINAIGQLHLGADFRYVNIRTQPMDNPNTSAWTGGCLFTQSWVTSQYATGLNVGFNEGADWGHIVCLQPSIAWKPLYINAGYIYAFSYGNYSAVLQPGGWVNVSDEREKTNIRPLKTSRSLERVLSAKTFTYNRLFYSDSAGNDLTPQDLKDKAHVGIVAQQVKESNPHCLSTFNSVNSNNEERFAVNYNDYVVHLLGAVQEQQKQIQQLIDHVGRLTEVVNKLSTGAITPR